MFRNILICANCGETSTFRALNGELIPNLSFWINQIGSVLNLFQLDANVISVIRRLGPVTIWFLDGPSIFIPLSGKSTQETLGSQDELDTQSYCP